MNRASRAGWRASWFVVPAYAVLTVAMTWPLSRALGRVLPASAGQGIELLGGPFLMGWDVRALSGDWSQVFRLPIFHPEPLALAYTDHLIGQALLAWPLVTFTGNLAVGYNAVVLLAFVASAWAVYRLARLLGVSRAGAFLAGLLFTFSPFRYSNLDFVNQIHTEFIPLGLFFALRFHHRHRRRDLIATVTALVVQSYFGWYDTLYLALAVVVLGIHAWTAGWIRRESVPWITAGIAALAGILVALPGMLPYLELQRLMPDYRRTLGMAALYSADLLDYLKVDRGNWLLGGWRWPTADLGCWPGLVTVPLAALGLGAWLRAPAGVGAVPVAGRPAEPRKPAAGGLRRTLSGWGDALARAARRGGDPGYFVVLGALAFLFSLGPVLHVAGRQLPLPLPYTALYVLFPGFSALRGPARMSVLVLLAAVVVAGIGYDACRRRLNRRDRRLGAGLFAGLAAIAILSSVSQVRLVPFPDRASMPPVYHWLAEQPGDFAILDLPVPATESEEGPEDMLRQFYILYHGKRRLDGMTGFVPPGVRRLRSALQDFPSAETLRELAARGARYLIVHLDELDPAQRAAWETGRLPAGLTRRARFADDLAIELDPASLEEGAMPGGA